MQNPPRSRVQESHVVQRPSVRRKRRLQSSFVEQLKHAACVAQNGRPLRKRKQRPLVFWGQGTPWEPERDEQELSRIVQPLATARARQRPTMRPVRSQFPEQQFPVLTGRQGRPLRRHERAAAGSAVPRTAARPTPTPRRSSTWREARPLPIALAQPSNWLPSMLVSVLSASNETLSMGALGPDTRAR